MGDRPSVVIAIATFRRPEGLSRLLDGIAVLDVAAQISVLVCDNDPENGAGLAVIDAYRADAEFPYPLRCIVEPQRGISFARNGLFAEIVRNYPCDFVAMIDDDEWPCVDWLAALLAVAERTQADVVGGPVASVFANPMTSPAVRNCAQFTQTQRPTGAVKVILSTENVLIRRRALDLVVGPWFDPAFALTGGEDADLFYRLRRAGARFAWANSALVKELVPAERSTRSWVIQRSFRRGCNTAWRALRRPGRTRAVARLVVLGLGAVVTFPAFWLASFGRPARRLDAWLRLSRAAGYFCGFAQFRVRDYDTVHGN